MKTVILINSNDKYTRGLREYIESLGFLVIGNFSKKEKLDRCKNIPKSSVAIVDHTIVMRGDGIAFARYLKKRNPKIEILYTLKPIERRDEASVLALKPHRILLKPINRSELKIALKMIFEKNLN